MFYDTFIDLCAKAGKKPTPVVVELGLSKMSVSNWKKGHMPSDISLKKVADYFGVTVEYLKTGEAVQNEKIPSHPQTQTTGDDFLKLYSMLTPERQAALRDNMLALLGEQMQGK